MNIPSKLNTCHNWIFQGLPAILLPNNPITAGIMPKQVMTAIIRMTLLVS
jgi:hypothetical protein